MTPPSPSDADRARQTSTAGKKKTKNTTEKARIVERIAALAHAMPGLTVRTRVFLPDDRPRAEQREIDVLVTGPGLAGYEDRIAIECKNEKKPVGVDEVSEFVGKLADVGIPSQRGIIVSASGYTKGALGHIKRSGIRGLQLQSTSLATLERAVTGALQSVIYLSLSITGMSVIPGVTPNDAYEPYLFYNASGQVCGIVPDLVWHQWRQGDPPSVLGPAELILPVSPEWYQRVNDRLVQAQEVRVTVQVIGLVVERQGEIEEHQLVNVVNRALERGVVDVTMPALPERASLPVTTYLSEADLKSYLDRRPAAIRLTLGRIRLPRIKCGAAYWPLSEKAKARLKAFDQRIKSNEGTVRPTFEEIEGTDLSAVFDPVSPDHPAIQAALMAQVDEERILEALITYCQQSGATRIRLEQWGRAASGSFVIAVSADWGQPSALNSGSARLFRVHLDATTATIEEVGTGQPVDLDEFQSILNSL